MPVRTFLSGMEIVARDLVKPLRKWKPLNKALNSLKISQEKWPTYVWTNKTFLLKSNPKSLINFGRSMVIKRQIKLEGCCLNIRQKV